MRLARVAYAAIALLGLALPAPAQIVVYRDDFENGYAQWSMTGMWNAEASTDPCGGQLPVYPSGTHCAYFGNDTACNYLLGTSAHQGELLWSSPLTIPASGRVTLRFWDWREAECFNEPWTGLTTLYDKTYVQVSTNGGTAWTKIGETCEVFPVSQPYAAHSDWHPHVIDLTAYLGQQIHLRFSFNTVDANYNDFFGWAIDDVSILTDSSTATCFPQFTQVCPCAQALPFPYFAFPLVACKNSTRTTSELLATGSPIVSQDTLMLEARHLPANSPTLFFQGSTVSTGTAFGDGRLCMNGGFDRIAVVFASNGEAVYPTGAQPGIAIQGNVPLAGGTRSYQAYYRDSQAFCTSATFNVTSAFETVWTP